MYGTKEQAILNAEKWLKNIQNDGFLDVVMEFSKTDKDYFLFEFKHNITGKVALLSTHGLSDKEVDKMAFKPKVYWNGSSVSEPKFEDWLTAEYSFKIEYFKKR